MTIDLAQLRRAIALVSDTNAVPSARQIAYLRTYPALLRLARAPDHDGQFRMLQLAAAAYGWMPRILRMNPKHIDSAATAIEYAARATEKPPDSAIVDAVSRCLYSVVGASKVLHFANPTIYPIWDSKVQRVWGRVDPTQSFMAKTENYLDYAGQVHDLCRLREFADFAIALGQAHEARLSRLSIPAYKLSDIRIVESAAFELSGGEYDEA